MPRGAGEPCYRWFCGLSIEDKIPDHSAFSRARNERFRDSDIFRRMFERVVETCIAAGLVGGEGFAVDASLIVADANKQRSIPGKDWDKTRDPEAASRAVKEYLVMLDDAAFGAASEVTPKFVSPSDPAAQWTSAMRGPAFFAYADNYLIDVKFGIIMDVEATRAIRQAEVGAAKTMIERTEERFGLKPERLAADTAYGSGGHARLDRQRQGDRPAHPRLGSLQARRRHLSREDFIFDKGRNTYTCPAGKVLTTTGRIVNDDQLLYRASKFDCDVCPFKMRCCPKEPARKIPRSIHEEARDVARALAGTEAFEQSCRDRKRVEMLVRPSQAHPAAWPTEIARTARRPVRVHTGSHRPEPAPPWQAGGATAARGYRVRCVSVGSRASNRRSRRSERPKRGRSARAPPISTA